jgi:hypothetical protein
MLKVSVGGMKKKFQIKALTKADSKTGKISKRMALSDTATKRMSATALYPIKSTEKKHKAAVAMIRRALSKY